MFVNVNVNPTSNSFLIVSGEPYILIVPYFIIAIRSASSSASSKK